MVFGEKNKFAIEAYHEPSGLKWAGFGRLCVHVAGKSLGNILDNHCSLFHATDRFRELSGSIVNLWDEAFAGLSDAEIFSRIDDALYLGEPSELGPACAPFDFLTNTGEMFNGTKTFIVCRPNGRVSIFYQLRDDTFGSGACDVDFFQAAALEYVHWFDEQVRGVGPPYFPINPFDPNETIPGS